MIDLLQLRALHAVAASGSVRAAADALHVTTSALSQRLGKLERTVGQPLLERHGRGVKLTDAAHLLVDYANRIFSLVEEAEARVEAHRGAVAGRVTIAAFPTAARGLLVPTLSRLRPDHPALTVTLREQEPHESIPLVARGDLDLAVVQDWYNAPLAIPDGLHRSPLLDDLTDVALPENHRFADREFVNLEELSHETWVTWPPGSGCHEWLVSTLRLLGAEPDIAHTAGEYPTQFGLVAAGFGAAIIPRLGRDHLPDGVRIVPVQPVLSRHVYAVSRAESAKRPAVRAVIEAMQAVARDELRATA
ncbi:DNA-binding transcriptional regulator, LysR family [Amycolatopsis xylanica]|uniref:DNA-binding transcriptional regulator, LysR family n=1 Tax=Amycolatopsis xylanica TaxID=589385 RepID=A0A1H3EW78_9PSEU|nr:LysR family transcriptional regulator [Amycolatopsis xylanica]SDX82996.1 DNA-binding transcriptional regulator, LysR family [Amycolatopsis xylanica]